MATVLCYRSSSKHLISARADVPYYQAVPNAKSLLSAPISVDETTVNQFELPLHLLASELSLRRSSKSVRSHVCSSFLPKGSILDTGKGFYVCSPELTFVQMANVLSLPKLIELGFQFCGTYTARGDEIDQAEPLTTVKRLKSFLTKLHGVHGREKATRALRYIIEGSASPMESVLAMLLCLPYKMGGYGIAPPRLNYPVDVHIKTSKLAFTRHCICDLYWPDIRLAVEYDSNKFHAYREKMTADSIRREDLASVGITVISITNSHIQSCSEMHKTAHRIAKLLGKQLKYSDLCFSGKRSELRKELLTFT